MHLDLARQIYGQPLLAGDRLILMLAAILVAGLYWQFWGPSVDGTQASILVGGKYWSKVDLYENRIITVKGKNGDSVLKVENGKIRFISSACDTKLCVHRGWIKHTGEIIACVPNTVSVRILGSDPRFDAMNF